MPATAATAAELRRAVLYRADKLEEIARNLRGPVSTSRKDLRDALELVSQLPAEIRNIVDYEWQSNADPGVRALVLLPLLRHVNWVADFLEEHLSHGTRRELSEALVDEIRSELASLELSHYRIVISHGQANNFITKYGDFTRALFGLLASTPGVHLPQSTSYAFFKLPRIEGSGVAWRPILLGHEVAHIAVYERNAVQMFGLTAKFDLPRASGLLNPAARAGSSPPGVARGLYRIAENWAMELLCDAHALYRYGPSAISALGEYFLTIGATRAMSTTHPPGVLRMRLLLDHLGTVGDARLAEVIRPLSDDTPDSVTLGEPWADYLVELFQTHRTELWTTVTSFPTEQYLYADRVELIHAVADRLQEGVPGNEIVQLPSGALTAAIDPDVVNAAWLARVEAATTPIDSLARKAIESLELMRRWVNEGGSVPFDLYVQGSAIAAPVVGATLGQDLIASRLQTTGSERLSVTPLMQRPKGAALDLRLGNRFIIFRRTSTASFDPLNRDDDPRAIQEYAELSWSERFILHPQELVLGATLEYLVIPQDLTAQVVTRSSYGRLGLLSATAVQIHPNFHGCLTLELVNLSTIPLALTPGERIAQLVLSHTTPTPAPEDEKYTYSIGPEFSRVRDDAEADVLRAIRSP